MGRLNMLRSTVGNTSLSAPAPDAAMTGDVAAKVARDRPRIEVETATGGEADQHVDGLAGVEIRDRLRRRRPKRQHQQSRRRYDCRGGTRSPKLEHLNFSL